MNQQEYLQKYIDLCNDNLKENKRVLSILNNQGIYEKYILDNFNIGYSNDSLVELIGDNEDLLSFFHKEGILKNNKEVYSNHLVIPIYDEEKVVVNIAFYNPHPQSKNRLGIINTKGIFNAPFLKNNKE